MRTILGAPSRYGDRLVAVCAAWAGLGLLACKRVLGTSFFVVGTGFGGGPLGRLSWVGGGTSFISSSSSSSSAMAALFCVGGCSYSLCLVTVASLFLDTISLFLVALAIDASLSFLVMGSSLSFRLAASRRLDPLS